MQRYSSHFEVSKMGRMLGVSRSGYYAFLRRPESTRSKRQSEVLERIREIHRQSNAVYGSPTITRALCYSGMHVSKGMVSRLMRKNGIRSKIVKKYRVTTDSNHNLPVAENILDRNFKASRRNEKWVSDITYIGIGEGWLYLAGILDLYDGAIAYTDSQLGEIFARLNLRHGPNTDEIVRELARKNCGATYQQQARRTEQNPFQ